MLRSGRTLEAAPLLAGALAIAYLVAILVGAPALAGVTVLCALAGCGVALVRRPSRALRLGLAAVGVWLGVGFAGAFALSHRPLGGFAWVLLVLYLLPLPVVPWIYARTFPSDQETGAQGALRTPGSPSEEAQ
ncbi:MAG: hypothetical protein ACHQQS_12710 [Thermoanaerobaculales bacterium]